MTPNSWSRNLLGMLFAAMILLPGMAMAQESGSKAAPPNEPPGLYASLKGAWVLTHDTPFSTVGNYLLFDDADAEAVFSSTTGYGGAVGYRLNSGWQVEFEVFQWTNDFESMQWQRIGKFGNFPTTGEMQVTSYMLNAIGNFPKNNGFNLFLGAGIGGAHYKMNNVADSDGPLFTADETTIALQFLVGVDYSLTRNVSLNLAYKLFTSFVSPHTDPGQPGIGDEEHIVPIDVSSLVAGVSFRF